MNVIDEQYFATGELKYCSLTLIGAEMSVIVVFLKKRVIVIENNEKVILLISVKSANAFHTGQ